MKRLGPACWCCCLALAAPVAGCVTQSARRITERERAQRAVAAAERWVALVDKGDYDESWKQAAAYLRESVPREEWARMLRAGRGPLGKTVARRPHSAVYQTALPGAPDGEYMVVRFDTRFERKESAVETIVPMRDPDGVWRVSGYFIR